MIRQGEGRVTRIFVAFEPSYWRGMVCTLGSLARHARDHVTVEVMIRPEYRLAVEKLLNRISHATDGILTIRILEMNKYAISECDDLEYRSHFKAEICYRLFYFDLSNMSGDAAYIDIDTIFQMSIDEISAGLPVDMPLAARSHDHINKSIRNIYPDIKNYFNSGVLLFNIDRFANEVSQRMSDARRIMREISGVSDYLDQDALNLAFVNRWRALPARFNYMSIDSEPLNDGMGAILHATGSRKPWMLGSHHRYSPQYAQELVALGIPLWQRYDVKWICDRVAKRIGNRICR